MSDSDIVIVGCRGRMGGMLLERLGAAGCAVSGVDRPLDDAAVAQACRSAAVALLCVPAAVMGAVIARITPYLHPDAVLADITSVKMRPMEEMEKAWPGPVVGTHPLFGPRPLPDMELPVTITPGNHAAERDIVLVEEMFLRMGCRPFRSTAALHDEAMAAIQGLNFISSVAYFATFAGREDLLPFITPSFRRRQESARKLLTEDAELFEGLVEANPFSQEAVRRFRRFLSLAAAGDISLLAERAKWWWREQT